MVLTYNEALHCEARVEQLLMFIVLVMGDTAVVKAAHNTSQAGRDVREPSFEIATEK